MRIFLVLAVFLLVGCGSNEKETTKNPFTSAEIESILEDSISVRAIEVIDGNMAFAANKGMYGIYNAGPGSWNINVQAYDTILPEYRAVASTSTDFFMLSVGTPALLYKTGDTGAMELVYKEEGENVFYDAMIFWNDREGIAMGDPTQNCISVIITRDGGHNWTKLGCEELPPGIEGEAAFAASNSNIAVVGNHTWILTGGISSRVFYSPNKGQTWEVFDTPLVQGTPTTGGYSIDFYDEKNGFIIGGDYTNPNDNKANKATTSDGGKTWKLVGDGSGPGYKSSVRYVPNSGGEELVAVGESGISYTKDAGATWSQLSGQGFHTLRFLNDTTAYAAGNRKIARVKFK